jgi:hypothetical protein
VPPRGRQREALPRRARRALLRQHRLLVRRGDRTGGARADARAALLHELVICPPARDRAGGRGRLPGAGRPEPCLLRLRRLRGRRVGVEARAAVLHGARRETPARHGPRARAKPRRHRRRGARDAPLQGDRAPHRVSRDDVRRALDQRHPGAAHAVRALAARGAARPQHEPLPPAARGDGGGVHAGPPRGARADHPRDGPGDGLSRPHGARAERGRRVHAPCGLLARRAGALRPVRHPALCRRGDHRLRTPRLLVRLGALRHPAGHRHLREGPVLLVRRDRRRCRHRPRHGALPGVHLDSRTGSLSGATR